MRRSHFEHFRPVCPRCRASDQGVFELSIAVALKVDDAGIEQGILHCGNPSCMLEFPIIDGTPLIVPDVQGFVAENLAHLHKRHDLAAPLSSLLGDCAGPGSSLDVARQHQSIYAWDGYADLDPQEHRSPNGRVPASIARCLDVGVAALGREIGGSVIDLGCGVGRSTFELAAKTPELVLGVDVNIPLLQVAASALREGRVRYPKRRVGIVYDERSFPVDFPGRERCDFWACDILALPFRDETFAHAVALNVLDCVSSPVAMLTAMAAILGPGGTAVISTPYDWSPAATHPSAWMGGHSQRGPGEGDSRTVLQSLLSDRGTEPGGIGLREISSRECVPWHTRLHDRATVAYDLDVFALERVGATTPPPRPT